MRVSGWKAAQANQKCAPWTMGESSSPVNEPSTAFPSTFQRLPVSLSMIFSPSARKVSVWPAASGRKTPEAPMSRESAVPDRSSAEVVPGWKKTTIGSPPTVSWTTNRCSHRRSHVAMRIASPAIP